MPPSDRAPASHQSRLASEHSPATGPDNTRWTGDKASAFLRLLAQSGKVAPSARAVGMSRQAAYRLRARAPRFAEFWDRAMKVAQARSAAAKANMRASVHPLLAPATPCDDTVTDGTGQRDASHEKRHSRRPERHFGPRR